MSGISTPRADLSTQERLLIARGGGLSGGLQLGLLVALTSDSNADVSSAAAETLSRLPDSQLAALLADPLSTASR